MNQDSLVPSSDVKAFFGCSKKGSASFWEFIKRRGVPHIRVGARRIMFDPHALNAWLAMRDTSPHPQRFEFSSDGNVKFNRACDTPKLEIIPIPKGRTPSNEDIEQIALRVSSLIAAYLPSRVTKQLSSELETFIAGVAERGVNPGT